MATATSDIEFKSDERMIIAMRTECCKISTMQTQVCTTLVDDNLLLDLEDSVCIRSVDAVKTNPRSSAITKEELSRRWAIGLDTVANTLQVTTRKGIWNAVNPIHCQYQTRQTQLRYNQLNSKFYLDTMFATHKS